MREEMGGCALHRNRMMLLREVGELLREGRPTCPAVKLTILPRQGEVGRSDGGGGNET
jgi:hypothetical protein